MAVPMNDGARDTERMFMARSAPARPGDFATLDTVGGWRKAPRPPPGTHFITRVRIGRRYYRVMLDGGATCNTIPSDVVFLVIHDSRSLPAEGPPVLDLLDYSSDPVAIDWVKRGGRFG